MNMRHYKGSDANLIETANVVCRFLETDLTVFTDFDATLNSNFIIDFKAQIEVALHYSRDGMILDQQTQKTVYVKRLMKKACGVYMDIRYFASKAFPDNHEIRRELGYSEIGNARNIRTKMIVFLDELYAACTKYSVELYAVGMTSGKIEAIDTLRMDLMHAHTERESFAKHRTVITAERKAIFNSLYLMVTRINEAAQIVYRGNAVKQKIFVYWPSPVFKGKVVEMQATEISPLTPEEGLLMQDS